MYCNALIHSNVLCMMSHLLTFLLYKFAGSQDGWLPPDQHLPFLYLKKKKVVLYFRDITQNCLLYQRRELFYNFLQVNLVGVYFTNLLTKVLVKAMINNINFGRGGSNRSILKPLVGVLFHVH